jgi:hypothetical protein
MDRFPSLLPLHFPPTSALRPMLLFSVSLGAQSRLRPQSRPDSAGRVGAWHAGCRAAG